MAGLHVTQHGCYTLTGTWCRHSMCNSYRDSEGYTGEAGAGILPTASGPGLPSRPFWPGGTPNAISNGLKACEAVRSSTPCARAGIRVASYCGDKHLRLPQFMPKKCSSFFTVQVHLDLFLILRVAFRISSKSTSCTMDAACWGAGRIKRG